MRSFIDLQFQGVSQVIATAVVGDSGSLALIDPGPASCLPVLEAGLDGLGLRLSDVRALLLTHIHLDHAGAAGSICSRVPEVRVWVHERGARHLIDPSRLLASASRLYGDAMDTLWGPVLPVPADRIEVVTDGEVVSVESRRLRVLYTPGHAVHHVSYVDDTDGRAYVGDTGGIRVADGYLLAATPPPDIDLEAWSVSLDRIDKMNPKELFLTHFGVVENPRQHLQRFRRVLAEAAEAVRVTLALPGSDEDKIHRFVEQMRVDIRRELAEDAARSAELAAPFPQLWQGLARYWRKRE